MCRILLVLPAGQYWGVNIEVSDVTLVSEDIRHRGTQHLQYLCEGLQKQEFLEDSLISISQESDLHQS